MAHRLQDDEDKTRRQTIKTPTEWNYYRYYTPPEDFQNSSDFPSDGDAMPGEAVDPLGPFIARDGISWEKQKDGARPVLALHCIKLRLENES